jgi:hypothetical protein
MLDSRRDAFRFIEKSFVRGVQPRMGVKKPARRPAF